MEDTHVHALDYLNVFRRRKWWLLGPILASIVVGALLVQLLPKEFTSDATVAVVAPGVSPDVVNQAARMDNQERLRAVEQQLVSRPILARVISLEGLGSGADDDAAIMKMRDRISVKVPDPVATTNESRLDTFVVSYGDREPELAQRITNRLVNVFVDENSRSRAARAEDTSTFISNQLRLSQERLVELEAQLRQAQESHMGQLPEQMQANLQTLSGLRQQLEANATALRGEQDRLSMIERQIESLRQGSAEIFVASGGNGMHAAAPQTRVMLLEAQLAEARAMYKDKHPDVIKLLEDLESAKREAAAEKTGAPTSGRLAQLQLDPTYRQLSADRATAQLRVRDLQRTESDLRRQIGLYQSRVEGSPRVAQQLAAVTREYELEKKHYSDMAAKLQAAQLDENVERNRRGEQFAVLYAASLPLSPTKPIPWRIMLVSLVAGICLGGAATFGREYLDRSVHDVRDFRDEFDVPILGEVARIESV
jgi:polysaccharide chain length determinant protein (PEP-CTERM system associated)